MVGCFVVGLAWVVSAEDITVTTYYPSPRGVYEELRTTGNVGVGTTAAPTARLHVIQPGAPASFRVDDQAGDITPFIVDANGDVGIGVQPPSGPLAQLHVVQDGVAERLRVEGVGGDGFVISAAGSVGIAQTTPQVALHITDIDNDGLPPPNVRDIADLRIENLFGADTVLDIDVDTSSVWLDVDDDPDPALNTAELMLGLNQQPMINLDNNGNVGIGTVSPNAQLSVGASGLANWAVWGEGTNGGIYGKGALQGVDGESTSALGGSGVRGRSNNTTGQGVLGEGNGGSAGVIGKATGGGMGVRGESDTGWAGWFQGPVNMTGQLTLGGGIAGGGTVNGNFRVNGNLSVGGNVTGDVAEWMECVACQPSDVVVIDPAYNRRLIPSSKAYDQTVAGVISASPSLKIGQPPSESAQPLALAGLVHVKVTTENGPIKRGDLLVTSSKSGYAMRADGDSVRPGMLLGKALEALEEGDGAILILVE